MYKQATRINLQFETEKGILNLQQLWTLGTTSLSKAIKAINKKLKEQDKDDDELSFLGTNVSSKNKEDVLRFEILKDIYLTKKQEAEEEAAKVSKKEQNQKILELISRKKDTALEQMSVEELEKMLQ